MNFKETVNEILAVTVKYNLFFNKALALLIDFFFFFEKGNLAQAMNI